ncbi:hypothetical protein P7K49_013263, partial [Saguinus oedipus]
MSSQPEETPSLGGYNSFSWLHRLRTREQHLFRNKEQASLAFWRLPHPPSGTRQPPCIQTLSALVHTVPGTQSYIKGFLPQGVEDRQSTDDVTHGA